MLSKKYFYISILSFLAIEYIYILFFLPTTYKLQSEKTIFIVPVFVILLSVIDYFILERKINKSKEDFVIFFLASTGGKFIILLFSSLIYVVFFSKNHIEFVAIFFANYFTAMILSVSGLARMLKNK
jgi:hypothetical protein